MTTPTPTPQQESARRRERGPRATPQPALQEVDAAAQAAGLRLRKSRLTPGWLLISETHGWLAASAIDLADALSEIERHRRRERQRTNRAAYARTAP